MSKKPNHIILKKREVKKDPKIDKGRRISVTEIRCDSEKPIVTPMWKYEFPKCPVLIVGLGGTEISTFNEKTCQERHKHLICTEIYTVLEGKMAIKVEDNPEPIDLGCGDEIIVLPGTIHEVVMNKDTESLVRVHAINCYGNADKYWMDANGRWHQELTSNNQCKKPKR
jgi:mannose-6-phosphate isomerase-like protein (cupin superfamily)